MLTVACGDSGNDQPDAQVNDNHPDAASEPRAHVEGFLGYKGGDTARSLRTEGARKNGGGFETTTRAVLDSEETSIDGLSLELIQYDIGPPPDYPVTEVGVVDTTTPDATGSFAFVIPEEPWGYFEVRIKQEPDPLVSYVAGGQITWLYPTDTIQLSLPLVTRLYLPLWYDPTAEDRPELGNPQVRLGAHNRSGLLVYFTPRRGVGVYNPRTATVDLLKMSSLLLEFDCGFSQGLTSGCMHNELHVIEDTDQILLSRTRPPALSFPTQYVLIDLDIFADEDASEILDLDDPDTAAALADRVTVIDVPADATHCSPPQHDFYSAALFPVSVTTADGRRFYRAERGWTDVFDLEARTLVESWWCDGGHLGGYNAESGHLYFDLPGGTLRVRDADTGALVRDLDLGARFHNGIAVAEFPDQTRAIVSYQLDATPTEHRIAIIDSDAVVVEDHLAGDFLGFTNRYLDDAFDWVGPCSPNSCEVTPGCPPPDIFQSIEQLETNQGLVMYYDPVLEQLVMRDWVFQLRDGLFYPMPHYRCSRVGAEPSECIGQFHHDQIHKAVLVRSLWEPMTTCIVYIDGSDLAVSVKLDGEPSEFDSFLPFPGLGTGFVTNENSVTAIYYRNPDAVFLPAVRDMR
jgi:hypothetical protein